MDKTIRTRTNQETQPARGTDQPTMRRPRVPEPLRPQPAPPPPPTPVAAGPMPRPKRKKRNKRVMPRIAMIAAATTLAVAVLIVTGVAGIYAYHRANNLIVPGVRVGTVPVGGLSVEQAQAKLTAEWQGSETLVIVDGDRRWGANPGDFGLSLNAELTALNAVQVRGVWVMFQRQQVAPVVTVDAAQAELGLNAWADTVIDIPPQNATLRIEQGRVIPVAGQPGRALDVQASLDALLAAPSIALLDGTLPIVVREVPPQVQTAEAAVAEAEALLAAPVTLRMYDAVSDEWFEEQIAPETIAQWLRVEAGPSIAVDQSKVAASLGAVGAGLGTERYIDAEQAAEQVAASLDASRTATIIVSHHPTRYTVQSGDTLIRVAWKTGIPYWRILEANPGIDQDNLSTGQVLEIPSRDVVMPLPIVMGKRVRIDISEQHAYLYENDELIRDHVISTGIDRSPTQPGVFQMQTFERRAYASAWDLWMPDFIGIYEAWPGFMNGFHGLPTLSSGQQLWGSILGSPASYGCIIFDLDASAALFEWGEPGVIVEITE